MSYLFSKKQRYKIKKAVPGEEVLRALRAFLDKEEPGLVSFLVNTWRTQGKAITYKELREAILSGDISWDIIAEWQQDYAIFITEHMYPAWTKSMVASANELKKKHPGWIFDPQALGVREWTSQRAGKFITEVTGTQIEGIRAVIHRAAFFEDVTVDQLARVLRPMVGLTKPQAEANFRYYQHLLNHDVSQKRALDLSTRYAARQHRERAYTIARTEMAYAYNRGAYEGTKQAQEQGYMGDCVKVWSTADDERVCPICGGLEGQQVGMDEEFDFPTKLTTPGIRLTPPAHPRCRCSYLIKEITPPIHRVPTETT